VNDLSLLVIFLFVNGVIGILRDQVRKQRDLIQDVQRHLLPAMPSVSSELFWRESLVAIHASRPRKLPTNHRHAVANPRISE
jgi:hypothetical protein